MRKWIATFIGLALLVGGTAQGQTSKEPSEGFRADHHWSDVARGAGSASVGARQNRAGARRAGARPASPSMKGRGGATLSRSQVETAHQGHLPA